MKQCLIGPIGSLQTTVFRELDCEIVTFGGDLPHGLSHQGVEDWFSFTARFPAEFAPDLMFLIVDGDLPAWLWSAPLPIVAIVSKWRSRWHYLRRQLRRCQFVLASGGSAAALSREGLPNVLPVNTPAPTGPTDPTKTSPDTHRTLDVLYLGGVHPQRDCQELTILQQLARLGDRYRVQFLVDAKLEQASTAVKQAKTIFVSENELSLALAVNAINAGAMAFSLMNAGDGTVHDLTFRCPANELVECLVKYLDTDGERHLWVESAQERLASQDGARSWREALATVRMYKADISDPVRSDSTVTWWERTWRVVTAGQAADPALVRDLAQAVSRGAQAVNLHYLLGVAVSMDGSTNRPEACLAGLQHYQRAILEDPEHILAGIALAESLLVAGERQQAIVQAQQTLDAAHRLEDLSPEQRDSPLPPSCLSSMRWEWERCAWFNAGQPSKEAGAKLALLRWYLNVLLAKETDRLEHYYESVLARPDIGFTRAALGCALGRSQQPRRALPHLRQAVESDPFDREAARAYLNALQDVQDQRRMRRLSRDRFLLNRAEPNLCPVEDWFADASPAGDELASIVMPCFNLVHLTRQCLESILRHTKTPYELIVIDDGSRDETPTVLREFQRTAHSPFLLRFEIITNETNQGYSAATNQGLAAARGEYLVTINNDVVVTPQWLEGLIDWSLQDWPRIGLVSPMTNNAPAPQWTQVDYSDLRDLTAFARKHQTERRGKAMEVDRLGGFCLLMRREVYAKIGGNDEQFTGYFDDDDLCLRAKNAGFGLLVACDVFVHHYGGSPTHTAAGRACDRLLQENFERFRAKHGDERASRYHLDPQRRLNQNGTPDTINTITPVTPREIPRVSLCMIVKNEERNLPGCLESVAGLFDEVIVVDTGSEDRTKAIAHAAGAKVFNFPWIDSFAAARNESVKHATGDWIFWLDADDRIDAENREILKALLQALPAGNAAFVMKCLCLPDHQSGTATTVDHVRLFRNHPRLRWRYRVHEQILLALRELDAEIRWSDVVIHHTGYQDRQQRGSKLERDMRLLRMEFQEDANDPFVLFNLGWTLFEIGNYREAITYLTRSLDLSQPGDSIVRKVYAILVQCHRGIGDTAEALRFCRTGRQHFPADVELLYEDGCLNLELGQLSRAEACFVELIFQPSGAYFASVDPALRGYRARHLLGDICIRQRRFREAEEHWQIALTERPTFVPSLVALGELRIDQKRLDEIPALLDRLRQLPESEIDANVLQARVDMVKGDYRQAIAILEDVCIRHPKAILPRIVRSHALLQENRDAKAAEHALREVLELDPNNVQAQHNLKLLLSC